MKGCLRLHYAPRSPAARAFTMLEVLVSMSVLIVLMTILLSIVNGTTKLWRQGENRVDSFREARAALNVMASDLDSILISKKPKFFALDISAGLPSSAVKAPEANNLFFVSSLSSDSQEPGRNKSELCIVGYFLAYDSPTFGKVEPSMNLYRYFLSSDESIERIKGDAPLALDISTAAGSANVEVLARNITTLKIRPFVVKPDGKPAPFPEGAATVPDFVDIQITALNNDSAKKMKKEDWTDTTTPVMKNIFKENARTFSTRVNLAPLILSQ